MGDGETRIVSGSNSFTKIAKEEKRGLACSFSASLLFHGTKADTPFSLRPFKLTSRHFLV
jgi:hypothetical protein